MTLADLLAAHDRPDAVCVDGRSLPGPALADAAARVAVGLVGLPVVAVDAAPVLETVVAVVGALLAGVPVVPVAPDAGPGERRHILADCGATVLLATRATPADLPAGLEVVAVDAAATGPSGQTPPGAGTGPALILYTSGTTGPPKGVVVSHRAIAADLDGLASAWSWTADDVLVHGLPLFHVHGLVLGVLGALRTGCRLVHTGRPTPAAYAAAAAAGGSLFFGVPTVWSRIAADPAAAAALRPARLLVSGSAALPRPAFEALRAACGQGPLERYGMTETLITVAGTVDGPRRPGVVGRPLPGVATRLVDDDGGPLPADGEAVGALEVTGPTVMDGYLGRPADTAAAFRPDGWFRTGDAAVVAPDGTHRIVGRQSSDLIKTGGYRVGAGEVEDALLAHPGVAEAAVVGAADPDLGQVIVAYVVGDVDPDALREWTAGELATHKRPRRVVVVDSLPRNAMGKVQKRQLGD